MEDNVQLCSSFDSNDHVLLLFENDAVREKGVCEDVTNEDPANIFTISEGELATLGIKDDNASMLLQLPVDSDLPKSEESKFSIEDNKIMFHEVSPDTSPEEGWFYDETYPVDLPVARYEVLDPEGQLIEENKENLMLFEPASFTVPLPKKKKKGSTEKKKKKCSKDKKKNYVCPFEGCGKHLYCINGHFHRHVKSHKLKDKNMRCPRCPAQFLESRLEYHNQKYHPGL